MRDVLDQVDAWRKGQEEFAIATVVSTWGSAPRAAWIETDLLAEGWDGWFGERRLCRRGCD